MVTALENFGTLSNWRRDHHNDGFDDFKEIPTWLLREATYNSPYVAFSDREVQDREFQPLDQLSADEQSIVDRFNPRALWPWLYINGQYAAADTGVPPGLLQGRAFEDVYAQLTSGAQDEASQAIRAEARLITRYICHSTGDQPTNVCGS